MASSSLSTRSRFVAAGEAVRDQDRFGAARSRHARSAPGLWATALQAQWRRKQRDPEERRLMRRTATGWGAREGRLSFLVSISPTPVGGWRSHPFWLPMSD